MFEEFDYDKFVWVLDCDYLQDPEAFMTDQAMEEQFRVIEFLNLGYILGKPKEEYYHSHGLYRPKNWIDKILDYLC